VPSALPPSKDDLLARAQSGDPTAFDQLAREVGPRLIRSAHAFCGDTHLARDLAQETLFEAWKSIARFDARCALSTWLHGILRHRFLKSLRRAKHRPSLQLLADTPDPTDSTQSSPADAAGDRDQATLLRQQVATLPEEQRLVVELRFFADASLEDIAAALECPEGTVKSRLHHALRNLRENKLNLSTRSGESPVYP
jgi:RNA polymerase sigma-70 factor (ECF subfamily)